MWKMLQITVAVATGLAMIYWREHDPEMRDALGNGYAIAVVCLLAALLATAVFSGIGRLWTWLRPQKSRAHKGLRQGVLNGGAGRVGNQILSRDSSREVGP